MERDDDGVKEAMDLVLRSDLWRLGCNERRKGKLFDEEDTASSVITK